MANSCGNGDLSHFICINLSTGTRTLATINPIHCWLLKILLLAVGPILVCSEVACRILCAFSSALFHFHARVLDGLHNSMSKQHGGYSRTFHQPTWAPNTDQSTQQSNSSTVLIWNSVAHKNRYKSDRKLFNFDWFRASVWSARGDLAIFPALWLDLPRHAIEASTSFSVARARLKLVRVNELISIARAIFFVPFFLLFLLFIVLFFCSFAVFFFLAQVRVYVTDESVSKRIPNTHTLCALQRVLTSHCFKIPRDNKSAKNEFAISTSCSLEIHSNLGFIHSVDAFLLCCASLLEIGRAAERQRLVHLQLCTFSAFLLHLKRQQFIDRSWAHSQCSAAAARHLNIHTFSSHLLIIRQF